MKKRKELNALIGLDGRRKKPTKKGSGHRLLRTEPPASDSESSSEEDEFAVPGARGRLARGDYLRCCKFCYPLCAFVILAACVVACVGLVWMQVALKEDLDALKEKFRTMESNQKTSFQEIPKLNEDLLQKQKQLEQIETGELGLNKIWINITEINKQVSLLTSTVNHLKTSIKSASDLIILPVTVEKLQKASNARVAICKCIPALSCSCASVPDLTGSVIVLLTARMLQRLSKLTCSGFIFQESQSLHTALEELNNTVVTYQKLNDIKLLNVDSAIGNLSQRVTLLESSLVAVNKLDKRGNSSTSGVNIWYLWVSTQASNLNTFHMETGIRNSQVLKLKEELQMITALSSKSANDRSAEASKNVASSTSATAKPTDLPRLTSRSADDNTENQQLRHLSLPGVSSIQDLQDWFEKATHNADGKLSYEDLQKQLGFTVQELQSFKKFDTDGDEKYSLQELRIALGV
ncbi:EFC14 protein, partial [Crypturellus undulatus]|nr:EFC14 protein [Crypturellus undulatus]